MQAIVFCHIVEFNDYLLRKQYVTVIMKRYCYCFIFKDKCLLRREAYYGVFMGQWRFGRRCSEKCVCVFLLAVEKNMRLPADRCYAWLCN